MRRVGSLKGLTFGDATWAGSLQPAECFYRRRFRAFHSKPVELTASHSDSASEGLGRSPNCLNASPTGRTA